MSERYKPFKIYNDVTFCFGRSLIISLHSNILRLCDNISLTILLKKSKMQAPRNKIVMLGDAGVGKTAYVRRLTENTFSEDISPTIGAAYTEYNYSYKGKKEKIQIWDTAGSELFRSMAPIYGRNAFGAVIMYDITNKNSFQSILEWQDLLQEDIPILVLGNKSDLKEERQVTEEEAHEFCITNRFEYAECSAVTGENIPESFRSILQKCFEVREKLESLENKDLKRKNSDASNSGCC